MVVGIQAYEMTHCIWNDTLSATPGDSLHGFINFSKKKNEGGWLPHKKGKKKTITGPNTWVVVAYLDLFS